MFQILCWKLIAMNLFLIYKRACCLQFSCVLQSWYLSHTGNTQYCCDPGGRMYTNAYPLCNVSCLFFFPFFVWKLITLLCKHTLTITIVVHMKEEEEDDNTLAPVCVFVLVSTKHQCSSVCFYNHTHVRTNTHKAILSQFFQRVDFRVCWKSPRLSGWLLSSCFPSWNLLFQLCVSRCHRKQSLKHPVVSIGYKVASILFV